MNYIPVKIIDYYNDLVVCESITNIKLFTEFRDPRCVKIDILYIPRNTFKYKYIYRDKVYLMVKDEKELSNCKIIKKVDWARYIFEKYEKNLNKEFYKKKKRKNK